MLIIRNSNLISVKSWTYIWMSGLTSCPPTKQSQICGVSQNIALYQLLHCRALSLITYIDFIGDHHLGSAVQAFIIFFLCYALSNSTTQICFFVHFRFPALYSITIFSISKSVKEKNIYIIWQSIALSNYFELY